MKFETVAHYFERIEGESSRTQMTILLAELFKECLAQEAKIISYISSGSLFPPYKTLQFNMAKQAMIKVLAQTLSKDTQDIEKIFKELGDMGLVAQTGYIGKKSLLSIETVYGELVYCAQISGTGSTEKKQQQIVDLLKEVDNLSAKYIVRIITGTLRLGFSDMTILDALSWMYAGDKSIRPELERAYNMCADLGLVAYTLKQEGLKGIHAMHIQVGIPIRPAAAERMETSVEIIEKLGPCIAQPKLDGFRIQLHVKKLAQKNEIHFFSRNLLDMSDMFPDLYQVVQKLEVDSLICEGEAIVYDEATGTFLPFQETVKRKRKHDIEQVSQDLPLYLYIFDILYLNGQSLLDKPHHERRKLMEKVIDHRDDRLQVIDERRVSTGKELQDYFLELIGAGLEGLVVKRDDAIYQPGKRNFNWIKLKRHIEHILSDTIDCVVLGYYVGRGKRAHFGIGAFLVGVYNREEDRFQSVAKIGTGLSDDEWKDLKKKCDVKFVKDCPKNVSVSKGLFPDVWVQPDMVCTVHCDEITLSPIHTAGKKDDEPGYALRFPRFVHYRPDKSATDATTVAELVSMYKKQKTIIS